MDPESSLPPHWIEEIASKVKQETCAELHEKVAFIVRIMLDQFKEEVKSLISPAHYTYPVDMSKHGDHPLNMRSWKREQYVQRDDGHSGGISGRDSCPNCKLIADERDRIQAELEVTRHPWNRSEKLASDLQALVEEIRHGSSTSTARPVVTTVPSNTVAVMDSSAEKPDLAASSPEVRLTEKLNIHCEAIIKYHEGQENYEDFSNARKYLFKHRSLIPCMLKDFLKPYDCFIETKVKSLLSIADFMLSKPNNEHPEEAKIVLRKAWKWSIDTCKAHSDAKTLTLLAEISGNDGEYSESLDLMKRAYELSGSSKARQELCKLIVADCTDMKLKLKVMSHALDEAATDDKFDAYIEKGKVEGHLGLTAESEESFKRALECDREHAYDRVCNYDRASKRGIMNAYFSSAQNLIYLISSLYSKTYDVRHKIARKFFAAGTLSAHNRAFLELAACAIDAEQFLVSDWYQKYGSYLRLNNPHTSISKDSE